MVRFHRELTGTANQNHVIQGVEVANAAALAAYAPTILDVGRVVHQTDTNQLWLVTGYSPKTLGLVFTGIAPVVGIVDTDGKLTETITSEHMSRTDVWSGDVNEITGNAIDGFMLVPRDMNYYLIQSSWHTTQGVEYTATWTITGRTQGTLDLDLGSADAYNLTTSGTISWVQAIGGDSIYVNLYDDFDGRVQLSIVSTQITILPGTITPIIDTRMSDGSPAFQFRTGGIGSDNFFIGPNAGMETYGTGNLAIGRALTLNTSGSNNVAIGANALITSTITNNNIAIGTNAFKLAVGGNNVAIGTDSLSSIFDANNTDNIAIGYRALGNSTGFYVYSNIAIGSNSLRNLTNAAGNIALGKNALAANIGASNIIAIGTDAFAVATSPLGVAIGYMALSKSTAANFYNTAIGTFAMGHATDPRNSVAIGYGALSGDPSIANSPQYSVGIGDLSMSSLRGSATFSVAIGYSALSPLYSGDYNTAVGAGAANGAGEVGATRTVSRGTYIGYNSNPSATNGNTNETVIGANATGKGSNTVTIGNDSIVATYLKGNVFASGVPVRKIFDVKAYGAVGDGVTDDTVAIYNAWVASLELNQYDVYVQKGPLFFPKGAYLVTDTDSDGAIFDFSIYNGKTVRFTELKSDTISWATINSGEAPGGTVDLIKPANIMFIGVDLVGTNCRSAVHSPASSFTCFVGEFRWIGAEDYAFLLGSHATLTFAPGSGIGASRLNTGKCIAGESYGSYRIWLRIEPDNAFYGDGGAIDLSNFAMGGGSVSIDGAYLSSYNDYAGNPGYIGCAGRTLITNCRSDCSGTGTEFIFGNNGDEHANFIGNKIDGALVGVRIKTSTHSLIQNNTYGTSTTDILIDAGVTGVNIQEPSIPSSKVTYGGGALNTVPGTLVLSNGVDIIGQAYVDSTGSYVNNTGLWDDLQGPVEQAAGAAALTFEAYRDTGMFAYFMKHNQDDTLYKAYQMPHSWDRGTVKPHIHIIPMANPAATENIRFIGKYAWTQVGVALPADASWTPFTADHPVNTTDEFKQAVVPLVTIAPPTTPKESNVLLIWLQRPGASDAADTYTTSKVLGTAAANVMVVSIDCHIQKNKRGTSTEIPV